MNSLANKAIFPIPTPAGYTYNSNKDNLFWVPCDNESIPCMFIKNPKAKYLILYSHGNAEDIGYGLRYLDYMCSVLGAHGVSFEYPGYGAYIGSPTAEGINKTIQNVNQFIVSKLKWPQDKVIIFGRSIGTGPACLLANELCKQSTPPAGLILQSPYTSIKDIIGNFVPKFVNSFIAEMWNNCNSIYGVTCPSLLIHGLRDNLISWECSDKLHALCQSKSKHVQYYENVDHNSFDTRQVCDDVAKFISTIEFGDAPTISVPKEYFATPEHVVKYFEERKRVASMPWSTYLLSQSMALSKASVNSLSKSFGSDKKNDGNGGRKL